MTWMDTNSGPTTSDSFRSVLEDPDFTRPVTWRTGESTGEDGETVWQFGEPVETEFFISRPDADDLEILPHEPDDDVEYVLFAFLDRGVTRNDRISFDDGMSGPSPYRVEAPEVIEFDGDRFARHALTPDGRGEGSGDETSGGDGNYPVR